MTQKYFPAENVLATDDSEEEGFICLRQKCCPLMARIFTNYFLRH